MIPSPRTATFLILFGWIVGLVGLVGWLVCDLKIFIQNCSFPLLF